jgi:hypothetical protein
MIAGRSIASILLVGALVFGFQNCSKVAMSEVAFSDASLQAVPTSATGVVDDSGNAISPDPSSTPTGASGDGQVVSGDDTSTDGKTCNGKGKGNGGSHVNSGSDDDSSQSGSLVECELSSSKNKVVLSDSVTIGSNAQTSRICMSENACLNLVNEYAASHDCSLAPGAATSPSSNGVQCTKVFPGSKGTCKNAKVLSDADVSALLVKLGK